VAFLPLRRKSCYGVLLPLRIHHLRPGLNPRTLGLMESTITITPYRTTIFIIKISQCLQVEGVIVRAVTKMIRRRLRDVLTSAEDTSEVANFSFFSTSVTRFTITFCISLEHVKRFKYVMNLNVTMNMVF
jgi:hypothetical protein